MKLQFGELKITPQVVERLHDLDFTIPELEVAIREHKSDCDGNPSVYCGTYAKYNDGSLQGLWIDLSTFDDFEEFENFCNAIHADEEDPELMMQDYECFPEDFYSESCFCEDEFDGIKTYSELCEKHGKEAVDDFLEFFETEKLQDFTDYYCGQWDDEEDFARHIVDEGDYLRGCDFLAEYFDYDAFGDALFRDDYHMGSNGHVFYQCI